MVNFKRLTGFRLSPLVIAITGLMLAGPANSQEIDEQVVEAAEATSAAVTIEKTEDDDIEEVVVTGSRLRRSTFSSISPLQVISAEGSKEIGLVDAASLLQEAGASAGQQIDRTFNGFVLDNGPGASTVNLRGLGSSRTLVLINGRRLAPSGVEGAPSSPDANLIPASLVSQYEILLDGASSVYGSDAVAGVTNVKLVKDFDGFDIGWNSNLPEADNGEQNVLFLTWGKNWDRGFIGFGAEYAKTEPVKLADRAWTSQCDQHYEETTAGTIRRLGIEDQIELNQKASNCKRTSLVGRVIVPFSGSVYYTPGSSNGGWPSYTESSLFGIGVDANSDGAGDINFIDYSLNGADVDTANLYGGANKSTVMSYGEYTFDGDMNLKPYYEALYVKYKSSSNGGPAQFFPTVPANNPFNICNPNGANGVDCGLAYDALLTNPAFAEQVRQQFGGTPADFGILQGAVGARSSQPVVSVRGDRDSVSVEGEQLRLVAGLSGDLPFMNFASFKDWTFDSYVSYTRSDTSSMRTGIHEGRLDLSLETTIEDPSNPGNYICGADADGDGVPDGTDGCVPVNLYASSLYSSLIGDFATKAERDYLFDTRDFNTKVYQTITSIYASGVIWELPAGDIQMGIGGEIRLDRIKSVPDDIARDGLFFGFFADGGATGGKYTREIFGEVEIPLLGNKFLAKEVNLNLSSRYTKDEFYGAAWTYAGKLGYRPVDSLLIRSTYGSSYRAPNLRENFLKNQTGFRNISDPCLIPEDAINPITGGYDASRDNRSEVLLSNCLANGVDPTMASNNGNNTYSVEVANGGQRNLQEETSKSFSVGFSFEQPFFEQFDMTVGATYYSIDVEDTIVEPSAQFLVNDCYFSVGNTSTFCQRLARDGDSLLDNINAEFLNRDEETVRGVDVNLEYSQDITLFDRPFTVRVDLEFNRILENSDTFTNDAGDEDYDNDVGQFGYSKWRSRSEIRVDYDDWRFTWQMRYIGSVRQDRDGLDEYSDVADTNDTGFTGDTCQGLANGDVDCRDVGYAGNYMVHSMSLSYSPDTWFARLGVRNVFDRAPPRVDGDEVFAVNNTPIGAGYDLGGREFFLQVGMNFGGE